MHFGRLLFMRVALLFTGAEPVVMVWTLDHEGRFVIVALVPLSEALAELPSS